MLAVGGRRRIRWSGRRHSYGYTSIASSSLPRSVILSRVPGPWKLAKKASRPELPVSWSLATSSKTVDPGRETNASGHQASSQDRFKLRGVSSDQLRPV